MMLKKGTRVEFTMKGEKLYGVVEKGGENKVSVVIDGAVHTVGGPARAFEISSKPLPKDVPSVMDKWGVVCYKCLEMASDETDCFEAYITLNGKKVISVSNAGRGGPNNYYDIGNTPENGKIRDAFFSDVRAWAEQFGWKNPTEPEDTWVYWYERKRPYGVTAAQEIGEFVKQMAEYEEAARRG